MIPAKVRVAAVLALVAIPFVARPATHVFASCDGPVDLGYTDRGINDPGNGNALGDVELYLVRCDSGV